MTPEQIMMVFPRAQRDWADAISAIAPRHGITGVARESAFLGQVGHECSGFRVFEENLNYSAERLMAVWPRRFPTLESALPYARNPRALANLVYANRMGNGPPESGDGYRYRGRGAIMLTGRDNYKRFGDAMCVPLLADPDLAATPMIGSGIACRFWEDAGLNELADRGDHRAITRKINGGLVGLDARLKLTERAAGVLQNAAI